jgi:hypothetical protein
VPFTPVDSGIDGRSPATSEHGANDVADPHVPITLCEVCPVAAPSVNAPPEIAQVSQLAPGAEQDVAPPPIAAQSSGTAHRVVVTVP